MTQRQAYDPPSGGYEIKDSGERKEFSSGMVRDTAEGKTNWLSVRVGPMLRRWAVHCTNGRIKYPDPDPGVPNWTLAEGPEELLRFQESAARHFEQWLAGDRDEDHAAGVFFNINGAEYVRDKMNSVSVHTDIRVPPGTIICMEPGEDPKAAVRRYIDEVISLRPDTGADELGRGRSDVNGLDP